MKNNILIIEDNDDIRESTAEILSLAGYQVITAVNGKEGVEQAQKNLPNLIICDIMMPELDGFGVLYLLGKNSETATIPFIFLTAKAERLDMRKGMEMGADDYLTKPFDDIELLNAVECRLKKSNQQKEFYTQGLQKLHDFVSKTDGNEALQNVIQTKKNRTLKKGQIIYYEGDVAKGIYLILKGRIKISKLNEDGKEFLTGIFNKDEYFGLHDALLSSLHTESAEAMEDSIICLLNKEQIDDLLSKYPSLSMQFIHLLASSLQQKETQLIQLAYHSVRKRMAETIIRIAEINKKNSFKISRDDLAAMAGMATETVSRTLSSFKEENLIEKKGNEIQILNLDKLLKMKN